MPLRTEFRLARCLASVIMLSTGLLGTGATRAQDAVGSLVEVTAGAARFQVAPDFEVTLAAGPPLVRHPMMGCFDDRGRLYLAESAGLNLRPDDLESQLPNFVRRLEDTDGDGVYDKSTMFADKMTFPQGALWYEGSLYVAAPPNIWRLEDTDDDGVADVREVLVDQFGYNGNGASVHGCFLSPNGRIYWCDGRHGHEFTDEQGNVISKKSGSYLFSCLPDGSDVQIHCGGGMDNPVEVDFTAAGEVIGTVNILYSRPRNDCLVHWLHGGAYPHSERVLGELKRTGDLLGPVHKFGHVAVSGTTRYRSGALRSDFRDNYFVTIFNTGKVQRVELQREGASFAAVERDFLTCLSKDFHPTDVLEDADGSLLVIDTGGWFRIGCPTSQIAKPEIAGGIYRVRRRDAPPVADAFGQQIVWKELPSSELFERLDDRRFRVREAAIAEAARRGDAVLRLFQAAFPAASPQAKLGMIWAAARMRRPPAGLIAMAAADDHVDVRVAACHAAASVPHESQRGGAPREVVATLREALRDSHPAVRREAATSLGKLRATQAIDDLLQTAANAVDRTEEHALIYALIEINRPEPVLRQLASENAAVQRAALWALDQMDASELSVQQTAPLLASDSPLVRRAALQVFLRHDDWHQEVGEVLDQWLTNAAREGRREVIVGLVSAFAGSEQVSPVVGTHLAGGDAETVAWLLDALGQTSQLPLHESWVAPIHAALASRDNERVMRGLAAIRGIKGDRFDGFVAGLAADRSRAAPLRLAACETLVVHQPQLHPDTFRYLLSSLGGDATPAERNRAANVITMARLNKEQLASLAKALRSAGPLQLRMLIQPFRRHLDAATTRQFLSELAGAASFNTLAPHELSDIVKTFPAEHLEQANALLDKLKAIDTAKRAQLETLVASAETGDAARGKELFFAEQSKCKQCHRIGAVGGQIGPDLTTIGRIRDQRDLLESIVFPSASLAREYEPHTVVLTDGRVLSGIIVHETPAVIHMQPSEGKPMVIARDEIDSLVPSAISIMPQGLQKELTAQQLLDLVAYLRTLRQP